MARKQQLLSSQAIGFSAEVHDSTSFYGIPDGVSNSSSTKFLLGSFTCGHTSIFNKKSNNYIYLQVTRSIRFSRLK